MKISFERNKIKRLINYFGQSLNFKRKGKNEFGEETEDITEITINGVYHELSSHVSVSEGNATRTQSKPTPMVLTLYEEFNTNPILLDDTLFVNKKLYRVTGATNIQEGNYGVDISLELIQ